MQAALREGFPFSTFETVRTLLDLIANKQQLPTNSGIEMITCQGGNRTWNGPARFRRDAQILQHLCRTPVRPDRH